MQSTCSQFAWTAWCKHISAHTTSYFSLAHATCPFQSIYLSLPNLSTYAFYTFLLYWIIFLINSLHSTMNEVWPSSMSSEYVGIFTCYMKFSVLALGEWSKYDLFHSYSIVFSFLLPIYSLSFCSLLFFVSRACVIHIFQLSCDTIMFLEHLLLFINNINTLHVHCITC